jgi:hypothetical protein
LAKPVHLVSQPTLPWLFAPRSPRGAKVRRLLDQLGARPADEDEPVGVLLSAGAGSHHLVGRCWTTPSKRRDPLVRVVEQLGSTSGIRFAAWRPLWHSHPKATVCHQETLGLFPKQGRPATRSDVRAAGLHLPSRTGERHRGTKGPELCNSSSRSAMCCCASTSHSTRSSWSPRGHAAGRPVPGRQGHRRSARKARGSPVVRPRRSG